MNTSLNGLYINNNKLDNNINNDINNNKLDDDINNNKLDDDINNNKLDNDINNNKLDNDNKLWTSDRELWIKYQFKEFKKKYNLPWEWTFKLDNAFLRCGMCDYDNWNITISKPYLLHKNRLKSEIINTLLHEIAHALVGYENSHNNIWREKALEIGCDGEPCNRIALFVEPKYYLTCSKRCYSQPRYRKSKCNKLCILCKEQMILIPNTTT